MYKEVPPIDIFRPATLRVLANGDVLGFRELSKRAAEHLGLTAEAYEEVLPSGQSRYLNRMNWACSALVKAGLVARPKRGMYQITVDGLTVDSRNLVSYSEKDLLEWPMWQAYQQEVAERKQSSGTVQSVADEDEQTVVDPVELAENSAKSHNAAIETELRQKLQENSPQFFEKAVVDLLWAMGYGGPYGEREHVGRSGDGGIDGVIRQDALGLNKVYIQAKRYADDNKVGSPAIQQFFGALTSRGADRGVFITTSKFSEEAKRQAEIYKSIVLIDGIKLTKLMLDYKVGVQPQLNLVLYKVDEDYFEE